jgi:hypothetical protein
MDDDDDEAIVDDPDYQERLNRIFHEHAKFQTKQARKRNSSGRSHASYPSDGG